jgi:dipeptidyl-peptidase-4
MVLVLTLAFGSFSLVAAGASPQAGSISLESIYSADASVRVSYSGSVPRISWRDDATMVRREADGWVAFDQTGASRPAVANLAQIEAALAAIPGLQADDVAAMLREAEGALAQGAAALLLNRASDLFYVNGAAVAKRLTFDAAPEVGEELSPDGRFASFVRNHNIYLIEVASGRERQLTADGNEELFYGRLDWVYQEEIYGRGNFKGYWWSPDSSAIAFLRLDESPVREFTVVDHIPTTLTTEVTNYPKAGHPNPKVWLGVIPAIGGETVWVDTAAYEPIEHLIVSVGWTPGGDRVVYQVQDREQTWLDVNVANPASGNSTTLMRERTEAFVQQLGEPHWLPDGTFLWFSERSGYKHLYHYGFTAGDTPELLHEVTSGEWEARTLHGVAADGWVYFSGTADSPIAAQVYRVRLDGSGMTRLSRRAGTHSALFNPGFTRYVDTWSDVSTPPQVRLHAADGTELEVLAANRVEALEGLDLGPVEFLQVPTRDGFMMEAMMIRPPDFDPARRYPVLQYNYGGPHAPVVRNGWGGTTYMWHQMLAQQGYIIWYCDNRSASGKGIKPTWEAYEQLGVVELRDIEDGLTFLQEQPYVDPGRIGIWGWSYGGFMAAYALTHSQSFKAGIAGAPVTDWRLYDTIYTERYMRMPQNNPDGYDATSVVNSAADLHGSLLIVHGTMDDNVHMQNSVQLVYELQKAGKEFDLMVYPRSRHGVRERELVWHLRRTMTDFVLEKL